MSREIKFKYIWSNQAKTNFISQIFTLDEIEAGNQFMVLENEPLLKDYKLIARVQFTGLKDENGKEIFEKMEIDNKFIVDFQNGSYILRNISNNNIIYFYDYIKQNEKLPEITREYSEI